MTKCVEELGGVLSQQHYQPRLSMTSLDYKPGPVGGRPATRSRLPRYSLGTPSRRWIDLHLGNIILSLAAGRRVRVLDLGCNDGAYHTFLESTGLVGSYVGVDIEPSPEWSRASSAARDLSAHFLVHDAHEIAALRPSGFDLVVAITTFEHFKDDERVLDGVAQQLLPGAHLVMIVPSEFSYALYGPHGYRRYKLAETARRLQARRLEVVRAERIGGVPSFVCHAVWFNSSRIFTLAGKAALGVLAGFSRPRAKRWFGALDTSLNDAMFWHQRFAIGRAAHSLANEALASIDTMVPGLAALYLFVAKKPF